MQLKSGAILTESQCPVCRAGSIHCTMSSSSSFSLLASPDPLDADVVIVGGGPAGLMAADVLAHAGRSVHLFDAMPSVGRKFLLAGRGGLNLTHSEPRPQFDQRYAQGQAWVGAWLDGMDGEQVRAWAQSLGIDTFVGTSGRVFPTEMKAAPLLRTWLQRLRHPQTGVPVQFHMRHRWQGALQHNANAPHPFTLVFDTPTLQHLVHTFGATQLMVGTDYPFNFHDNRPIDRIQEAGFDASVVAHLTHANAKRFLGIEAINLE